MAAIPGFYSVDNSPTFDEVQAAKEREAQRVKLARWRDNRIASLKREIQVAKQRMREYDHFLAELQQLERDRREEKKVADEAARKTFKNRR